VAGLQKQKTHPAEPWVGLDVRFSTLLLPSRFAHPLTRVGPQQQQQPQQQSIELEKVMRIVSIQVLLNFRTAAGTWCRRGAVSLSLRLGIRYGARCFVSRLAWLVKTGLVASGTYSMIEQGIEMRRPSRITVQARLEGDTVRSILVLGRTISVAEGRFFLP
jgi:hypothetical protein